MLSNQDPFGLRLLFELVKGNKAASSYVLLLMEIFTITLVGVVVWQVLSQILPTQLTALWTAFITTCGFCIYGALRVSKFFKLPALEQERWQLPVTALVLALLLGFFSILVLRGTFDSPDSNLPGLVFYASFYGVPLIGFLIIAMNFIAFIQAKRWNGTMLAGNLISMAILSIFLLWHFLALGLSGYIYPCLVDIVALIVLAILMAAYAKRN
jgi:hypothetical protein